jgi:hypothetical protein
MDEEQRVAHKDESEEKVQPENIRHVGVFVTGVAQVRSGEATELEAFLVVRVIVEAVAVQVNGHHCKRT